LFGIYYFLGDDQNALSNINKAIENNENDFDAIFMLGNFYYKRNDYQNALIWLEKAEKLLETRQHVLTDSEYKGFKKMMEKVRKGK
jgi:tetratricopeptide (TPR) repeat protein